LQPVLAPSWVQAVTEGRRTALAIAFSLLLRYRAVEAVAVGTVEAVVEAAGAVASSVVKVIAGAVVKAVAIGLSL
jgi:hypothetical protein